MLSHAISVHDRVENNIIDVFLYCSYISQLEKVFLEGNLSVLMKKFKYMYYSTSSSSSGFSYLFYSVGIKVHVKDVHHGIY